MQNKLSGHAPVRCLYVAQHKDPPSFGAAATVTTAVVREEGNKAYLNHEQSRAAPESEISALSSETNICILAWKGEPGAGREQGKLCASWHIGTCPWCPASTGQQGCPEPLGRSCSGTGADVRGADLARLPLARVVFRHLMQ